MSMSKRSDVLRFLLRLPLPDGCWEHRGFARGAARMGYRGVLVNGRAEYAHRFMFELTKGKIPKGILVMHTCDNPACVNPKHLRLGTPKDNTQDGLSKGRVLLENKKLTVDRAEEIRRIYGAGGTTQKELAEQFGVSQAAISSITRGRTLTRRRVA